MSNSYKDGTTKKIQKAIGQPFAIEFTDYARKIRTNLMFVGVLIIVIVTQNLELSQNSSFLGVRFDNLNTAMAVRILLILNIYLLIHFIWLAIDNFTEWWIRLTGTRSLNSFDFDRTSAQMAEKYADDATDQRQSTLYYWWVDQHTLIKDYPKSIDSLSKKLKELSENTSSDTDRGIASSLLHVQERLVGIDNNLTFAPK